MNKQNRKYDLFELFMQDLSCVLKEQDLSSFSKMDNLAEFLVQGLYIPGKAIHLNAFSTSHKPPGLKEFYSNHREANAIINSTENPNLEIMRLNKIISLLMLTGLSSSCVKVYKPKIKSSELNKYVVSGQIITGQNTQTVSVSFTSSISNPTYKPLTGCSVNISDGKNDRFSTVDMGNGDYTTMIPPKYLVPGNAFKVSILTPSGDSLVSDYDTLKNVPAVDSIYYQRKSEVDQKTGMTTDGIQFYINFKGNSTDSRYYRWIVYETWKYHAEYPLEAYYDGTLHIVHPWNYSMFTCWRTRKIPKIFTLSTADLSENKYDRSPLQYVDNTTPRLANGYSMLVEQLALSREAYNYWNKLKINSIQTGGLYEKQPATIKGNIHDITHPEKQVLGFFSTASASYKRIFTPPIPGLIMNITGSNCWTNPVGAGLLAIPPSDYPVYLIFSSAGRTGFVMAGPACVNCMLQGGDTIKPSFWPN